jgi:hypothetical protein
MINTNDIWHIQHKRIHNLLPTVINDPQSYSCSIIAYIRGHGQMIIEVMETLEDTYEPSFYLLLDSVWYFEGPTHWQGADFRLSSFEEVKELLKQGWINVDGLLDEFAKHYIILTLERPTFKVRILASSCYIENKSPGIHISYADESS